MLGREADGNKLVDTTSRRSQRWEMVSQLLSAAAEAELRHLRDERRGQNPSSLLRAPAPAILRTSASGKASCSSGSAPICCCVSEHRGPAAITAARSQTGVLCCFLRAAASFDMPISRSYKQKASASKAAERRCAAGSATLGRIAARIRTDGPVYAMGERSRGHRRPMWRAPGAEAQAADVPTLALIPSQIYLA